MRWLRLTAGLLIWAAHFAGVYLISSLGDVAASADAWSWRAAGLAFSAVCFTAAAGVAIRFRRGGRSGAATSWEDHVSGGGALVAVVGVVWQTLPLLIV